MDIRALTPEDLPVLLELTCQVFEPFYEESFRPVAGDTVYRNRHPDWRGDYQRMLAALHTPAENRFAAVAWTGDTIAGYVGYVVQPEERHAEIEIIAVRPGARRQGAAQALVDHVLGILKTDGVEVVSLGTGGDDFHAPARAFYESVGFTPFPTVSYTLDLTQRP